MEDIIIINIRTLTTEDVNDYRKLRLESLKEAPFAFVSTYKNEQVASIETFKLRVKNNNNQFVVGAFDEEKLVAMAAFKRAGKGNISHRGHIADVYTSKNYRAQGLSKRVVKRLIEYVNNLNDIAIITLTVGSNNPGAENLYKSLGFKVYGVEPKALIYNNEYVEGIMMYLDIEHTCKKA